VYEKDVSGRRFAAVEFSDQRGHFFGFDQKILDANKVRSPGQTTAECGRNDQVAFADHIA